MVRNDRLVRMNSMQKPTGHGAAQIEEHFGDGCDLDLEIQYAVEDQPLGSGGALRDAAPGGDRHPGRAIQKK